MSEQKLKTELVQRRALEDRENTTVVKELLEDLVARGLDPERRYLFVIDGAKALRAGIDRVFGQRAEIHGNYIRAYCGHGKRPALARNIPPEQAECECRGTAFLPTRIGFCKRDF